MKKEIFASVTHATGTDDFLFLLYAMARLSFMPPFLQPDPGHFRCHQLIRVCAVSLRVLGIPESGLSGVVSATAAPDHQIIPFFKLRFTNLVASESRPLSSGACPTVRFLYLRRRTSRSPFHSGDVDSCASRCFPVAHFPQIGPLPS
jgi:hypothetical protein